MALESILFRKYTHQSDVWSYGEFLSILQVPILKTLSTYESYSGDGGVSAMLFTPH